MSTDVHQHPREVLAERNAGAILDAAERLLAHGEQTSVSALAGEAGLSRPTVYAHFPNRLRVLEALVERTVRQAMETLEAAEPERGPALAALQRLLATGWEEIERHEAIGAAATGQLSGEAMRRAHESAREVIRRLLERGRSEGAFRTDVPTGWLITSTLALIHAAAEEIRAANLDAQAALELLTAMVTELVVGPES
jgi:TetR/AcrR family transcriptional regulator, mexCD-oprJ operon repressor